MRQILLNKTGQRLEHLKMSTRKFMSLEMIAAMNMTTRFQDMKKMRRQKNKKRKLPKY